MTWWLEAWTWEEELSLDLWPVLLWPCHFVKFSFSELWFLHLYVHYDEPVTYNRCVDTGIRRYSIYVGTNKSCCLPWRSFYYGREENILLFKVIRTFLEFTPWATFCEFRGERSLQTGNGLCSSDLVHCCTPVWGCTGKWSSRNWKRNWGGQA